jgi:hypothetical protein
MSLTTTDVLKIQSAIDAYEKNFPHRPSPDAAEALAWRAGKRGREQRSSMPGERLRGKLGAWILALRPGAAKP